MPTVELTKDDFEQTIVDNDLVLVDFWAEWCGPCRSFAPIYEDASNEHGDVVFAKVDTEAQQELAQYFEIRSIPTLMVFKEKVRIFSQPGALPGSALQDLIAQAKDLDMAPIHEEIAKTADHEDHAGHEDHSDHEHA
ncbi:MAG: thioredoxin [Acidimicrobiia bacterium]|nr:thioredoxin [Acidimicrobiia bacterium]